MAYPISRQDQENLLNLAAAATETVGWKTDAVAFAVMLGEAPEIKAIGVFEDFTAAREATFSFALMRPGFGMTRGLIDALLKLAFHPRALNLDRLWMQAAADNVASQVAMIKLGAGFEYRKRGAIRGNASGADIARDAIVFSLVSPKLTAPAARAQDEEG